MRARGGAGFCFENERELKKREKLTKGEWPFCSSAAKERAETHVFEKEKESRYFSLIVTAQVTNLLLIRNGATKFAKRERENRERRC